MAKEQQDALTKAINNPKAAMALVAMLMAQAGEHPLDPEKGHIAGVSEHDKENIILPKGMEKDVAAAELMRQFEEEETLIDQRHENLMLLVS